MPIGILNLLLFVALTLNVVQCQTTNRFVAKLRIDRYNLFDDMPRTNRKKRYVLNKRWTRNILTWTLHKENINEADMFIIRNTLHRAFVNWAEVSSLRFIEVPVESKIQADLNISFLKGKHNDRLPFDGPAGVVAHAYYPDVGVLHFDADEQWTLNQMEGINLYQTAVHEVGHLLGLAHSNDHRSAMFPQNKKFDLKYGLSDDDVRGIRRLYPPSKQPQRLPTKPLNDNSV